jgi:BON domain
MKLLSCGALLLFAAMAMGQQQAPPPYSTPPTFPQEQKPTEPMPPDTKAPPPESMPSADVQQQMQKKLATEPLLANADVNATVDDTSVVLTGTVESEEQHDLALRIAESYAGDRRIVDRLKVRQRA